MIVVDTSVWASALLSRDAHFAQSTAWLDFSILRGQEMHFPMIVVPELAGALVRSGVSVLIIADEISNESGGRGSAVP